MFSDFKCKYFSQSNKYSPKLYKTAQKAIRKCRTTMAFSRFPYYVYDDVVRSSHGEDKGPNSWLSMVKYKEGNCVAFAYFIRDFMISAGYHAYLVPAKTPDMYAIDGALELSHVAVCVPFSGKKNGYILMDGSFYFKKPIVVGNSKDDSLDIKNPYSGTKHRFDFSLERRKTLKILNLPYGDFEIISVDISDSSKNVVDYVFYCMCEIENPDAAITVHTNELDGQFFYCSNTKKGDVDVYLNITKNMIRTRIRKNLYSLITIPEVLTFKDDGTRQVHLKVLKEHPFFKKLKKKNKKLHALLFRNTCKFLREH